MRHNPTYESDIAEINMTPFVDIILVILVIFMVTATFVTQGKIPLNLPQATSSENHKDDIKPITLSLTESGELYYDDDIISIAQKLDIGKSTIYKMMQNGELN